MKVIFDQVTLLILLHLILLTKVYGSQRGNNYATGSPIRKQPIPEASNKQETLKFGAKILKPINDVNKFQNTTITTTTTESTTYTRSSGQKRNRNNNSLRQYEIPVIYKNHTVTKTQNKLPRSRSNFFNRTATNTQLKPTRSSGFATTHLKAGYSQRRLNATTKSAKTTTTTTTTTTSTTTTSTTTTTTTPPPNPLFALGNAFNFFNLWNLSNPPPEPSTTKRPPKKYVQSMKIEKSNAKPLISAIKATKPKEVIITPKPTYFTTAFPATTPKELTEGPFRIDLPTHIFPSGAPKRSVPVNETDKEKRAIDETPSLRSRFNCPRENEVRFQLFPKDCKNDKDCSIWNRDEICCEIFGVKSCVNGIPKPLQESQHEPILGVIQRKCPARPLAELWWQVQECETDKDCWPRVCCPDGRRRYCRTSQPELEAAPVQVKRSFNYLTEYLECTAPPPLIFDLHPKACTSTLDCFPNVCCQESGLRHCRPPKKSLLTWMANFLNSDFVKKLTQNIVIK